jgi:colanic acid/amylovoran biosynthesis protein
MIADYVPSLNKGELELLIGTMKTLDQIGRTNVDIFSYYPAIERTRFPKGVRLVDVCKDLQVERFLRGGTVSSVLLASFLAGVQHILFISLYRLFGSNALRIMKKPLWQRYSSSDVFIGCFDETDCVNGNLLKLSPVYISLLAKTLHKLNVVYANSNTVTTNTVWLWRLQSRKLWDLLATYFLNNVDLITVRDEDTFQRYRSHVQDKLKVHSTADPGVLMDPVDSETVKRIMAREKIQKPSKGLLIGAEMTQRLLLHTHPEYSTNQEKYYRAAEEIAQVLDKLILEYQANVVFVPHCIEYYRDNDDRDVAKDVLNKMKNKTNVKTINNEYSAQELKGLIGQFDVFITDRIHALVSALSMNVPCCTLAYRSDKRPFNMIGKDFKQEKWIYEVDTLNSDTLYKFLTEIITSSQEIRKTLPAVTQQVKKRAMLNGQLLKTLLQSKGVL